MGRAVLCAIDETTAPGAHEVAGDLAERLGSSLVLTHVAQDPAIFNSVVERERARHAAKRHGEELLSRAMGALAAAVEPVARPEVGAPIEGLLDAAREEDAELIVTGTRGRLSLTSALLGSISRSLAREAPCPVVIVPRTALDEHGHVARRPSGPSCLVCGVDETDRSWRAARFAADLARRLGDRLVVVVGGEPPDGPPPPELVAGAAEVVRYEGALAPGLEAIAQAERARLIAVGGRARGSFPALLEGLAEGGLVRHAPVPFVVLPDTATIEPGTLHYELEGAA